MFWDSTYILVIIGAVICMIASANVSRTYKKYSRIYSKSNMTGAQAAERLLRAAGISDVKIGHISGNLTDHYNPTTKVLNLSDTVYDSTSVVAIGVAAHECGHAIQHATAYAPLNIRKAIVPVVNLGAKLSWPLIFLGLLINSESSQTFFNLGIILFSLVVVFQFITLPVEFDASRRAQLILGTQGILDNQELVYTRKVLTAAALTYVAAVVSSLLQLLRLIMLFGGRRSDD